VLAAVVAGLLASATAAQPKIELKLAYFVGGQHAMVQWLVEWSEGL
jgi:hypothetical protein